MEIPQHTGLKAIWGVFLLSGGIIALITGVMIYKDGQNNFVLLILVAFVGVVFIVAGFALLKQHQKIIKYRKNLLNKGIRFNAEIVMLKQDKSFRLQNKSPYLVECIYENEQKERIRVKSKYLWPRRKYINSPEELQAEIYVDRIEPEQYYILVRDKKKHTYFSKGIKRS